MFFNFLYYMKICTDFKYRLEYLKYLKVLYFFNDFVALLMLFSKIYLVLKMLSHAVFVMSFSKDM